jgi:hypothetical protein
LTSLLVLTHHERISDSQFFPSKDRALIRPVGQYTANRYEKTNMVT